MLIAQAATMIGEGKVSGALQRTLASRGPNDRVEAIVIYRSDKKTAPPRGRLRRPAARLSLVKEQAKRQRAIQRKIAASYETVTRTAMRGDAALAVAGVGSSALPAAKVEVTQKTLPALLEDRDVVAIMPNQRIHLIEPRRVDFADLRRQERTAGLTWGLQQLDVKRLWQASKGRDISVGVLDTGVWGDHPALKRRVTSFVVVDPQGRRITASPTFDGGQHGTHVCGTIAGGKADGKIAIGVAPECNLLVAAVLVGEATISTLLEGMSWAVENGADVISMSLGFTYYEPLFTEVFETLRGYGVLPVVAIGNENHGNTSSPGSAYNALAVGAVEKVSAKKVDVAFFSSGASFVFPGGEAPLVTKPDVVAPGVDVLSSIPPEQRPDGTHHYTYMDGTSMATPHVAGAVTVLMGAEPDAPIEDIAQALRDTAFHPAGSDARPDNRWGYGMIRPVEALRALRS